MNADTFEAETLRHEAIYNSLIPAVIKLSRLSRHIRAQSDENQEEQRSAMRAVEGELCAAARRLVQADQAYSNAFDAELRPEPKLRVALAELLDAAVEAAPCYQEFLGMPEDEHKKYLNRPDVVDRFKRVRETAHAFVEADTAAIIAESTFVGPPERAQ